MGRYFTISALTVLLVGVLFLLSTLAGRVEAILLAGIVLGILSYLLSKLSPVPSISTSGWETYAPLFSTLVGIVLGGGIGWGVIFGKASAAPSIYALSEYEFITANFIALFLAGLAGGFLLYRTQRKQVERCHRCQSPLDAERFYCPRGEGHWVCANCWLAEAFRCRDCDWLKTPLLALEDESWWNERLGERLLVGQCLRCKRDARSCDLRKCGRCPGAMCINCWDQENGRCVRCVWLIPDLPHSLARLHVTQDLGQERRAPHHAGI